MNRPIVSRTAAGQTLLSLACLGLFTSLLAGQEAGATLEKEMGERVKKTVTETLQLSKKRFPSADELGEGWFTPWNMPEAMKGRLTGAGEQVRAEEEWQAKRLGFWLVLAGQKEEANAAFVRTLIEKSVRAERERAKKAPEESRPTPVTKETITALIAMQLRTFTLPVYESQMVAATRALDQMVWLAETTEKVKRKFTEEREALQKELGALQSAEPSEERDNAIRRLEAQLVELGKRQRKEEDRLAEQLGMDVIAILCPDFKGKSSEQVIKIVLDEARSIRQAADMVYLHVAPQDAERARKDPSFIPPFGQVTVQLRVLSREALRARITDPTEQQLRQKAKELEAAYRRMARFALARAGKDGKEGGSGEARLLADVKIRVERRKLGDDAWVLFMETPPLPDGRTVTMYHGRLRNGNAIVNIEATGTRDRDWMVKQIDYFLNSLDDRTRIFRD